MTIRITSQNCRLQIKGWFIEYCLSQPALEEHCKVQFSVMIMIVVCLCNLAKTLVMGYVFWQQPVEPLVTLGDALRSFLNNPDPTTDGSCLAGEDRFIDYTAMVPLVDVECARSSKERRSMIASPNQRGGHYHGDYSSGTSSEFSTSIRSAIQQPTMRQTGYRLARWRPTSRVRYWDKEGVIYQSAERRMV